MCLVMTVELGILWHALSLSVLSPEAAAAVAS